jgi:hypothetical protein
MHCQQPLEAHTRRPDGDSDCPDGKNTFNFEFQINPEVAAYVQANMDKSSEELTAGWIEHIRARDRARAAAEAALQRDGALIRAKLDRGEALTLFDALGSIGAMMDEHWHGEWTGPILFNDHKGASRLILVEQEDHDLFDAWLREHAPDSEEMQQLAETFKDLTDPFVDGLQEHARHALVRMATRPVPSEGGAP